MQSRLPDTGHSRRIITAANYRLKRGRGARSAVYSGTANGETILALQTEFQTASISDALRATIALGLPVLKGILFALKTDRAERLGG